MVDRQNTAKNKYSKAKFSLCCNNNFRGCDILREKTGAILCLALGAPIPLPCLIFDFFSNKGGVVFISVFMLILG